MSKSSDIDVKLSQGKISFHFSLFSTAYYYLSNNFKLCLDFKMSIIKSNVRDKLDQSIIFFQELKVKIDPYWNAD